MNRPEIRKLDKSAAGFLEQPYVKIVFDAIETHGGIARVAGGAVRNALMGEPVTDIDMATDLTPAELVKAAENAGLKAVPTGIDHGTITVVVSGMTIEVTSLRTDVKTDGRHAIVKFGTDWSEDAHRRDFTVNAIYADKQACLYDYVGGFDDINSRTFRFIGDPSARIAEDHLRILRLFRFFAWYGSQQAGRPDADALRACAKAKESLKKLSAERIWKELRKLLSAPDPVRALLWMRTTGVLGQILPESEKWGIDAIPSLIEVGKENAWQIDPILRLASIVPMRVKTMKELAKRLKLSNKDAKALIGMAQVSIPDARLDDREFSHFLYFNGYEALARQLRLCISAASRRQDQAEIEQRQIQLSQLNNYVRPEFPVRGQDLIEAGMAKGPELGKELRRLEGVWVASDFTMTKSQLLSH